MLDGKEITETSKQFLRSWQATKDAYKRKRTSMQRQITQGTGNKYYLKVVYFRYNVQ